MWNTGCNVVYNRTSKRALYIVDGEDPTRMLVVPPGGEAAFNGTIAPWANSDSEVTSKAFRVEYFTSAQNLRGWFYVYQDYKTDLVCWADWTSVSPYEDGSANAASFKASYVDIQVDVDDDGEPVVEFVKVW
jgi:hypothetical protein